MTYLISMYGLKAGLIATPALLFMSCIASMMALLI
jgi:hypothetical protein